MRHVTHMVFKSQLSGDLSISHMNQSSAYMNESRHAHECVMSLVWDSIFNSLVRYLPQTSLTNIMSNVTCNFFSDVSSTCIESFLIIYFAVDVKADDLIVSGDLTDYEDRDSGDESCLG